MDYGVEETAPRKLLSRASLAGIGTLYQQGISFLSGLIVARVIGAAQYGVFNLARTLIEIVSIVTRLGLELGLQRYFGETNSVANRSLRVMVLRQVRLAAACAAVLPIIAVALGLGQFLQAHVYQHADFAKILLCLALALPFTTDVAVLAGAYRGTLKIEPCLLVECVVMPTARLLVIVVLFLFGWRLWAVVTGTVVGSLVAALMLAARARNDFDVHADVTAVQSWAEARRVIKYSVVLAAAVLVTTLTSTMDILMLGHFTTAQDLGQYSLAKMLICIIGLLGSAFNQNLGTLIADRFYRNDRAGMVRVMSMTFRWITLATLPIFAGFLFWGAQLTLLFGPSFAISQSVVAWLAAGQFVFALFSTAGWALSMTGKHMLELKILIAGLVLAVLLCFVAVPAYGQLGAAVATFIAIAATNLLRVLYVRQSVQALPFDLEILLIVAAGLGLAWSVKVLVAHFALSSVAGAVLGTGSFFLTYVVACWIYLRNTPTGGDINAIA